MHKLALLLLGCFLQTNMPAQVTIGSSKKPKPFSILEVNSSIGGIRYPQMNVTTRDLMSLNNSKAYGLIIFNTSNNDLECFVEDIGWTAVTTKNNTENIGALATIETGNIESTSTTFNYNFLIRFSSLEEVSNLRVGKHLGTFNTVTKVEGKVDQPLNQITYPIKVVVSKERLAALNDMDSEIHCYAIYQEKGIDRRIKFIINTSNNRRLVAEK